MKRLNESQVDAYKTNGYLLYKQPVLNDTQFRKLCDIFEALYAGFKIWHARGRNPHGNPVQN